MIHGARQELEDALSQAKIVRELHEAASGTSGDFPDPFTGSDNTEEGKEDTTFDATYFDYWNVPKDERVNLEIGEAVSPPEVRKQIDTHFINVFRERIKKDRKSKLVISARAPNEFLNPNVKKITRNVWPNEEQFKLTHNGSTVNVNSELYYQEKESLFTKPRPIFYNAAIKDERDNMRIALEIALSPQGVQEVVIKDYDFFEYRGKENPLRIMTDHNPLLSHLISRLRELRGEDAGVNMIRIQLGEGARDIIIKGESQPLKDHSIIRVVTQQ